MKFLSLFAFFAMIPLAEAQTTKSDSKKPQTGAAKTVVQHVTGADAKKVLDDNAAAVKAGKAAAITVIDVRTPVEYAEGHVKGSKNIDVNDKEFEAELVKLDKSKPYLVHCQAGGRSKKSLATFEKLGFKSIIHMDDGFKAWKGAGHPVEK